MKFGLRSTTGIKSGISRVFGRRLTSHEKANRSTRLVVDRFDAVDGIGLEWASAKYGDYYATSAAIHAAVRTRADAVGRPELRVEKSTPSTTSSTPRTWQEVGENHPLQQLIDRPNGSWNKAELIRSIESNLLLWGSAFLGIEKNESGSIIELWPLRPDRMRVIPDVRKYVRGFVYEHAGERAAYLPEEIVWFKHFNPLEEFAGLPSVAPARLAVDMGFEAAKFNRNFFANSATSGDLVITNDDSPSTDEISAFYTRWDSRFKGTSKSHRPLLLNRGMDAKRLSITQRDMEFAKALEWSIEEVSRAFGVPTVFLGELENSTLSNVNTFERFLWRNTIVPELKLIEDCLNRSLIPAFGIAQHEYRFKFDISTVEALNDSEDSQVTREVSLVNAGIITPNEVRTRHGLQPETWGVTAKIK
ncbi:MAG: phage portal protein [Chloroflexi bacterium]|nr:phage portal protein [Chloroflexota bacterium]